ncbi:MAG TPA: DUF3107 domain-containing protein [Acidimicrobiales bacterium]|nr:DUF3107 domain-containing protein [Acidimicrobiales bacterium]
MDVRIGVTYTAREIEVELGDDADRDTIVADLEAALANENGVVWLDDRRGRRYGVPVGKVAWIEIDHATEDRRVGFGVS